MEEKEEEKGRKRGHSAGVEGQFTQVIPLFKLMD
jgi:hypothetical protein